MSTSAPNTTDKPALESTRWRLDPTRSHVEFHTPTLWGLMTVKGRFERYHGTLDLRQQPAIELTIEAASLDTNNNIRDKHLRSGDFFDVENQKPRTGPLRLRQRNAKRRAADGQRPALRSRREHAARSGRQTASG